MSIFKQDNLKYEGIASYQLKALGFTPGYHENHVKFPNRVEGRPVTQIGFCAFMNDRILEAVDFSCNIDIIEQRAFEGCTHLKYVFFENNNALLQIHNRAFADCDLLTSLTILRPTTISFEAFRYCKNLRNIDVCAIEVRDYAFANCPMLHTVLLRGETVSIYENAFAKSKRIDKIYIDGKIVGSLDFAKQLPFSTEIHCRKGSSVEELVYEGFKIVTDIC